MIGSADMNPQPIMFGNGSSVKKAGFPPQRIIVILVLGEQDRDKTEQKNGTQFVHDRLLFGREYR